MSMITKQADGSYKVTGDINYETSQTFREELADTLGSDCINLDFKDVENISSSGLRVLLELAKSGSKVKILNVSGTVYDVFDMTGFGRFLTLERAIKEVSVKGLPCLGTGATGAAYRLDEEKIVKLFYDRIGKDRVAGELSTAKEAFLMGVPTCIPFEIVQDGNRYGIIYELIHSSTLGDLLAEADTDEENRLVRNYVNLLKKASSIHYEDISKGMNIKKAMVGAAIHLKDVFFTEEEYQKALKLFLNMEEGSNFVHGDAHPGNVMVQNGELIFIDMTTSGYGDPFWDLVAVASQCYVNTIFYAEDTFKEKYVMTADRAQDVFRKVFEIYYEGESAEKIAWNMQIAIGTASFRFLLGQLYNPNRDPDMISKLKKLALDAADLLND